MGVPLLYCDFKVSTYSPGFDLIVIIYRVFKKKETFMILKFLPVHPLCQGIIGIFP